MPGFRVDEARHDAIDGVEHLVGMLDLRGGGCEARVLENGEPAADEQHRNGDEEWPSPRLPDDMSRCPATEFMRSAPVWRAIGASTHRPRARRSPQARRQNTTPR